MIYICNIIFSTAAAIAVVVISCILMILLTLAFWREQIHRKSLAAAWIIFLLFVGLGLFYIRYSYMKVVDTHTKIYQDIFQHCARILQEKTQSNQPDCLLFPQQYLRYRKKNSTIIASFYLVKRPEIPLHPFAFLNLTTPLTDPVVTETNTAEPQTAEPDTDLAVWRDIPLIKIFGQDYLPQPIADALKQKRTVIGLVKRADYQENRLIFATPLFGQDENVVPFVLCLEIKEEDWLKELLFARILPHVFFFSFLFFFFAMQVVLIRRRIIVQNLKEHRITSFEQTLDHLISMKISAEEKSIDRNYLIRQIDSEFKKPLIPILESAFLLRQQIQKIQDAPDSLLDLEPRQANWALLEKMFLGCKKLKLVLSDIRTFIDFEWNKIGLQTEMFSPQQINHNLRNICQQYVLEKPNIKFRLDTISAIPEFVCGDQQKIQRVLEELLETAIDRVTNGHIKITCSMSGSLLCWIILDTGELLTENQTRQLNEFYNGEWTCHTEADGKLIFNFDFASSIAAAFTYLLKGNISFQSTAGHSNQCTAVFPVEI